MASAQYGRFEYWEERYMLRKEPFDWYQEWDGIKDIVTQYVQHSFKILHAGCGRSTLSVQMMNEGYENITNMDISQSAIEDMKSEYNDLPMQWDVKDVKRMDYPDRSFHAVIEKGLLDSILCGDRSSIMASRMINQVHRVLSAGGVYISITHAPPHWRLDYFDKSQWAVKSYEISKPRIPNLVLEDEGRHYIYVCSKL
jgi:ubiquinone/menaquinone biosynthesis C-methylase UbiE